MNYKVCCFNSRFLVLLEAPPSFKFTSKAARNTVKLHQTYNIFPNFIQSISLELERLCKEYNICAILYQEHSVMMNNFPNGTKKTITYYVYYTTMDDCIIDNVFYDELLTHLTDNIKLSFYTAQVFLQSLRHGFNKPDRRIDNLIREHKLPTQHDNLEEIRQLVLNLRPDQKQRIETLIAKNSTFNSILPNMLLLNVTNCIQQESLSIKHSGNKTDSEEFQSANLSSTPTKDDEDDIGGGEDYITIDEDEETGGDDDENNTNQNEQKFKTYTPNTEFQQHCYYCSYGPVVIVEANLQVSVFNNLIMKNIVSAFLVRSVHVDQLNIFLYIELSKFDQFSKIRIHGKILQYKIHNNNFILNADDIDYNVDMNIPQLYGTAPLLIANTKSLKDTFKSKIKVIQLYLIVCSNLLHRILRNWSAVCKVLRIITSPYNNQVFYHILVYINDGDTDFLYDYLPDNGLNNRPCKCDGRDEMLNPNLLPHSQKLWLLRPCIEILFHTHFDWTILKIHNDFMRRQSAVNIFKLYDVYESGRLKIAHLLDTKVFKATIENMTTFKFFNETGLLYPFQTSGHEELYIYTLIKMTRIVYRCIVLPLTKLDRLTAKHLLPSKYPLTYAFIDDPLTPTTSVRGPQSTRNLKSIESSDKLFDTKVINVTMLMNSFNLCGSESSENAIKI